MNFSAFDWFVLDASTRIWGKGQGFVLSAFPLLLIHLRCITLQKTQRVPCPPGPEPEACLGMWEPHAQMRSPRWRRVSTTWSFCWSASQSRWAFMSFMKFVVIKPNCCPEDSFSFMYILISLFVLVLMKCRDSPP